jgi:hypothetical protein
LENPHYLGGAARTRGGDRASGYRRQSSTGERLLVAKGLFERQEIDQATRIALQHLEASDEVESLKTKAAIHFQCALSLDNEKPKPAPPKFHGKSK